ncbi:DUF7660 family protein [Micromonospora sp. KLBMP9576]|uniref:DUF7660 family protein n=1 Tax=Micromonospora sp. KLBMP9576 TaxID=3424769 RepID=UPI003D902C55
MSSGYETGRFTNIRPDEVNHVTTHTDAAEIVGRMLTDLRAHPTEWENHTLERFLAALQSSLKALPGLYRNRGDHFPDPPTWKEFTEALIMATGRE